jgi:flagellar basal body-associated protein FliL
MNISERAVVLALAAFLAAQPAGAADRSAVILPVPGKPFFVQLAPIFVPVIAKDDSITHQVSIAVAIEIADGGKAHAVEERRPALTDAFLRDIYLFVQQRGGIGSPESETALKQRLLETASRILKPVAVRSVDIEEFFEQRR